MPRTDSIVIILLGVLVVTSVSAVNAADEKKDKKEPRRVFLSPDDAGEDFALQGEYRGTIQTKAGELTLGAQVIALGDGKFRAVAFPGGLPGEGWHKSDEKHQAEATRDGDSVTFSAKEKGSGVLANGRISIMNGEGTVIGDIPKIHRKSPTLGKKPPQGAVVLFDGSTPDNFKGGRMTEDKLLMEGVTSKATFGNFKLHIEFRLPFKPYDRGQGRGNSGCYMQGRYEVQMLDSFGLEGKNNECGGIYSIKDCDVNMCFPPLSWQTYDVDFTAAKYDEDGKKTENARMTVLHNGVKIHDNVELPKSTTAAPVKEGPAPGPIYLQNHGNPVRYRNIWVLPKAVRD